MKIQVPFNDLHAQYLTLKDKIDSAIVAVIKESAFVRGPYVNKFEKEFAELFGVENCISCANGTDALYIAMRALGVKNGDEVIAPCHSWISTTETISQAGGCVVFCNTDKDTYTIDIDDIELKITDKTVGIVPVHLYGQPADMDPIIELAIKHNLWVLEDCAQAHLAKYKGRLVGTFGDAATFSFYPGKNLGAMGDAGAIVTNNKALSEKMQRIARHGGLHKGEHLVEGVNSRLDGIQAAILSVKLPKLLDWTARRRDIAALYTQRLSVLHELTTPVIADGREHVFHLYVIQYKARDKLKSFLFDNGVQTIINYPIALPFLTAYKDLNHSPQDFPNAWSNQSKILSLPIYPEMTNEQVDYVCELIEEFVSIDHVT